MYIFRAPATITFSSMLQFTAECRELLSQLVEH